MCSLSECWNDLEIRCSDGCSRTSPASPEARAAAATLCTMLWNCSVFVAKSVSLLTCRVHCNSEHQSQKQEAVHYKQQMVCTALSGVLVNQHRRRTTNIPQQWQQHCHPVQCQSSLQQHVWMPAWPHSPEVTNANDSRAFRFVHCQCLMKNCTFLLAAAMPFFLRALYASSACR